MRKVQEDLVQHNEHLHRKQINDNDFSQYKQIYFNPLMKNKMDESLQYECFFFLQFDSYNYLTFLKICLDTQVAIIS